MYEPEASPRAPWGRGAFPLGEKAATQGARPPALAFWGRAVELDRVTRRFPAISGAGSVVMVEGPPGIGKTRLLEEIAGAAIDASIGVAGSVCRQAMLRLDLLSESLRGEGAVAAGPAGPESW